MLLTIIVSYSLFCLETHLPLLNHRNRSQSQVYFAFVPPTPWYRVAQIRTGALSRFRQHTPGDGPESLTHRRLLLLSSLHEISFTTYSENRGLRDWA